MAKPLSEKLSELALRAKQAEDSALAAQKETHDKIVVRRNETRNAAMAAVQQVDADLKKIGDDAEKRTDAVRAKIAVDMERLKAYVSDKKHEHDVKRAEKNAGRLEEDAEVAIDFASASIEQARLAVLDAIIGRVELEHARQV
jgi:hypothetical protein